MFVADIFGDYAAVAPMILLLIAALIIPAVHILGKKRTATWAVALVFVVASLLINLYMLTEEFTGSTLGMYLSLIHI